MADIQKGSVVEYKSGRGSVKEGTVTALGKDGKATIKPTLGGAKIVRLAKKLTLKT